jgi:hypothetical protein
MNCQQIDCPRCDAKGFLKEFSHIANGRCFLCAGAKTISLSTKYPKKAGKATYQQGVDRYRAQKQNGLKVNVIAPFEQIQILWGCKGDGQTITSDFDLTDENKPEMRALWRWLQENNFKTEVKANQENDLPYLRDERGRPI